MIGERRSEFHISGELETPVSFEWIDQIVPTLKSLIPLVSVLVVGVGVMVGVWWLLLRRAPTPSHGRGLRQLSLVALALVFVIAIILALPVTDKTQGDLLQVFGILVSAVIALSSANFVGNAMAGLMLRVVKNFRAGDFLRAGEHFGRVSEQGLLHTEIQTETRDLVTLPNSYLVTNPVTVVHSSGTIITAEVSLGYDVPRRQIERILREAAEAAELSDPYVYVMQLGDFSVTYRVAAFLEETRHLLTIRSRLREQMLDHLHGAGIEIVSPTFVNQRRFAPGEKLFVPETTAAAPSPEQELRPAIEEKMFDKAEEAENIERLKQRVRAYVEQIAELEGEAAAGEDAAVREQVQERIAELKRRKDRLTEYVESLAGSAAHKRPAVDNEADRAAREKRRAERAAARTEESAPAEAEEPPTEEKRAAAAEAGGTKAPPPEAAGEEKSAPADGEVPALEEKVFDKAEEAENLERLRERVKAYDEQIAALREEAKEHKKDTRERIQHRMEELKHRREQLSNYLESLEKKREQEKAGEAEHDVREEVAREAQRGLPGKE